jgi:hypothetical protein
MTSWASLMQLAHQISLIHKYLIVFVRRVYLESYMVSWFAAAPDGVDGSMLPQADATFGCSARGRFSKLRGRPVPERTALPVHHERNMEI